MRIAYVCYWYLLDRDGVSYKIDAQTERWREDGNDVEIFCLTRPFLDHTGERTGWRTFRFEQPLGRLAATRRLARAVRAFDPDVLYVRYDLFLPPVPRLVRTRASVVEINADDVEEAKLRPRRRRLAAAYNALNRRLVIGGADALVCVTHELAGSPRIAQFRRRTVVIGNGVDLDALRELPPPRNERPQLVFLGSARQVWHGVDKLGALAELLPEADFHVIGYDAGELGFEPPPNLLAHGVLGRAEYEPLLERSDVAIGTLALHRKNMHEACPLKVREYLGHGLPVVLGYRDTDLAGAERWFVLELPNAEENAVAGAAAIRAFLERVRGRRVPRAEIEELVGSAGKERRRLQLLDEVAADARRHAPAAGAAARAAS